MEAWRLAGKEGGDRSFRRERHGRIQKVWDWARFGDAPADRIRRGEASWPLRVLLRLWGPDELPLVCESVSPVYGHLQTVFSRACLLWNYLEGHIVYIEIVGLKKFKTPRQVQRHLINHT